MAKLSPVEMGKKIGEGLLSFPVTHFTSENAFDEGRYREHIAWMVENDPAGLFAAGGTGEFFSLTLGEFGSVVRAAVRCRRQVSLTDLLARYYGFLWATVKNLSPELSIHHHGQPGWLWSVADSQPPRSVCRESGWPAHRKKTTISGRPITPLNTGPRSAVRQECLPTSRSFLLDRRCLEPDPTIR